MRQPTPASERSTAIRSAFVLTVSDGVRGGTRVDESGPALIERLSGLGFDVESAVVGDEPDDIASTVGKALETHALVVTTGGTGLGPRDSTPQAVRRLLDYDVPGFGEVMRARGRASTAFADLSRSLAGVSGRSLVICVPGSRQAAVESLEAVEPLLEHALATIAGDTRRHPTNAGRG